MSGIRIMPITVPTIHLTMLQRRKMLGNGANQMVTNKVACIGAGYWGRNLVRNFSELGALTWVCELDPDRRNQLAAAYRTNRCTDKLDQVLADPDVSGVAIATPAETHGELVRRALLAGKDVL